MVHSRQLVCIALAALLCGCSAKPVPPEKAEYVGVWKGPKMSVSITQAGRVSYERSDGWIPKSADGTLQGFESDNFEVSVWGYTTTFIVSLPPHWVGDTKRMTVDGVELTKLP
jgi:hypothetical protein